MTEEKLAVPAILIVEDDSGAAASLVKFLSTMAACEKVDVAPNGDQVWQMILNTNYDLIFLDWKLPGISGLSLINRLRAHKVLQDCPVIILSGFLRKPDTNLIDEFPFTNVVGKAVNSRILYAEMAAILKRRSEYAEYRARIDQWNQVPSEEKLQAAPAIVSAVEEAGEHQLPLLRFANRWLIEVGLAKDAVELTQTYLSKEPTNLLCLTEAGRALLATGDYQKAMATLNEAQKTSSENLERFALMAETCMQQRDCASAINHLNKILAVDSKNEKAKRWLKIANFGVSYRERSNGEIPTNFAALMNLVCVDLIAQQKMEDALELHHEVIDLITDAYEQANLSYNLGVGLMKLQRNEEALPWFRKAYELSRGEFVKARECIEWLATKLGVAGAGESFKADPNKAPIEFSLNSDEFAIFGVEVAKKAS